MVLPFSVNFLMFALFKAKFLICKRQKLKYPSNPSSCLSVFIGFDSNLSNVRVTSTGTDTQFDPMSTPKCRISVYIKKVFFVEHFKSFSIRISSTSSIFLQMFRGCCGKCYQIVYVIRKSAFGFHWCKQTFHY